MLRVDAAEERLTIRPDLDIRGRNVWHMDRVPW